MNLNKILELLWSLRAKRGKLFSVPGGLRQIHILKGVISSFNLL